LRCLSRYSVKEEVNARGFAEGYRNLSYATGATTLASVLLRDIAQL